MQGLCRRSWIKTGRMRRARDCLHSNFGLMSDLTFCNSSVLHRTGCPTPREWSYLPSARSGLQWGRCLRRAGAALRPGCFQLKGAGPLDRRGSLASIGPACPLSLARCRPATAASVTSAAPVIRAATPIGSSIRSKLRRPDQHPHLCQQKAQPPRLRRRAPPRPVSSEGGHRLSEGPQSFDLTRPSSCFRSFVERGRRPARWQVICLSATRLRPSNDGPVDK